MNKQLKYILFVISLIILFVSLRVFYNNYLDYYFNHFQNQINQFQGRTVPFKRYPPFDNIAKQIKLYKDIILKKTTNDSIFKNHIKFKKNYNTITNSIYKLNNNEILPKESKIIHIDICQNEWESFQIIVSNLDLDSFKIVTDIDEALLEYEIFQGVFVDCRTPVYKPFYTGYIVDGLYKIDSIIYLQDTSIKEYLNLSNIWFNLKSNNYSNSREDFNIEINGFKNGIKQITYSFIVEVQFYKIKMPKKFKLKTSFSFNYDLYQYYYNIPLLTDSIRYSIYDFHIKYHLSPTFIYRYNDLFPPLTDWKYLIEKGVNSLCLGNFGQIFLDKGSINQKMIENIKNEYNYLKDNNIEEIAYVHGIEEPNYEMLNDIQEKTNDFRNIFPDLKIASNSIFYKELIGYIDYWTILQKDYKRSFVNTYLNNENFSEIWWYQCMSSTPPYPNFFMDANAIEPRIFFWQASFNNIKGVEYYATIWWISNFLYEQNSALSDSNITFLHNNIKIKDKLSKGIRWPEIPWNSYTWSKYNGDGQLFYPGKNGQLMPSVRLINIRDGIEDYEILEILKEKDKDLYLKYIYELNCSNSDLTKYESNPFMLINIRNEILNILKSK